MRVLFSNPPWWSKCDNIVLKDGNTDIQCYGGVRAGSRWPFTFLHRSIPDRYIFGDYTPYPFFMGYAATYVARYTNANVIFRDSIALKESYKTFFNYLKQEKFDFIVIESSTPSFETDIKIINRIKKILPFTKIILTGTIANCNEDLIQKYGLYAVINGEYEKGVVRVINGESGIIEQDLLSIEEMNNSPYPYYDSSIAYRYWDVNPKGQIFPQAQVWSSRGCPFKCIFCVWPAVMTGNDADGSGKRFVRQYSADYMEGFLSELVERYGFRSIYFDDDTFNLGDKHVVKMCEVMERIGLPWSAMCRTDTISLDTWKIMKEAGCFGVKIGFESGNQYVVNKIVNKNLDLTYSEKVVHHLKKIGMKVHGTFTYGLPGETIEQMADTKAFIARLPFDSVQQSGCAEIEGTPLHTLSKTGSLKNYEGAVIDSTYTREKDGAVKMKKLKDS